MQWNIAYLPIFVAVVKHRGISAAARELRMPKSSVSRNIQRLEDELNVRLFERNSRQMRMTQEGELFYKHCQLIMEQIQAADAQMNGLSHAPTGELSVSLPLAFSRLILSPQLYRFYQQYPDIKVSIDINPKAVDLIGEHIDVAVQIGELPDSDYIAVPLFSSRLIWVASRSIAKTIDSNITPALLQEKVVICEKRYNRTAIKFRLDQELSSMALNAAIESTDPVMVRDSVVNNMGVGLLPQWYCQKELDQGTIVEVAKNIQLIYLAKISAVYTSKRMLNARTRVFIDFLKLICQEHKVFVR